jgi:hypothetical protein
MAGPAAGDRAPDVAGLTRNGLGFPLRLFDVLKGTDHVLIVRLSAGAADEIAEAGSLARDIREKWGPLTRVVAITPAPLPDAPFLTILHDPQGRFAEAYGSDARAILVRPDGYIGWRGVSWSRKATGYLESVLGPVQGATGPVPDTD